MTTPKTAQVPAEPTEEMKIEGGKVLRGSPLSSRETAAAFCYRAMIDAAPASPPMQEPEEFASKWEADRHAEMMAGGHDCAVEVEETDPTFLRGQIEYLHGLNQHALDHICELETKVSAREDEIEALKAEVLFLRELHRGAEARASSARRAGIESTLPAIEAEAAKCDAMAETQTAAMDRAAWGMCAATCRVIGNAIRALLDHPSEAPAPLVRWRPVSEMPLGQWLVTRKTGESGNGICMKRRLNGDPEYVAPDGRTTITHHSYAAPDLWLDAPAPEKEAE